MVRIAYVLSMSHAVCVCSCWTITPTELARAQHSVLPMSPSNGIFDQRHAAMPPVLHPPPPCTLHMLHIPSMQDGSSAGLHAGPTWDKDLAFGNEAEVTSSDGWRYTDAETTNSGAMAQWYRSLLHARDFKHRVMERWKGLRQGACTASL